MPEETRRKLSVANRGKVKSLETREKLRVANLGHVVSEETREKISGRRVGTFHSITTRQRMSEIKAQAILDGTFKPGRGKMEYVETLKGGRVFCRSSYEVKYAQVLDDDPQVIAFAHERVRVDYFWQGRQHRTIVDFIVTHSDGRVTLDEVKPAWQISYYPQIRVKMLAAKAYAEERGFSYRWWDGENYRALHRIEEA